MRAGSSSSIRTQLALLVMACVVPAAAMAAFLIFYDYQRARDQLITNSVATVHAMASVVDSDLSSITASLRSLGTSPYLKSNDLAAFYAQAKDVLKSQQGDNIVLGNMIGTQYINTLRPFGTPLPQGTRLGLWTTMQKTREPMISMLFVGPIFRRPAIAIGVPVACNGMEMCSLSAGMFADRFIRHLQAQSLPPEWVGVIFDRNGAIVARTRDHARFVGRMASEDLITRSAASREGAFERRTVDGIAAVTVFSRSAISGWTVAIDIPSTTLTQALWRSLSRLILATTLLLASSLAGAWWAGGRIARSIRGLTRPALALGSGRPVIVPPLHLKEADEVGASLMKASEMLLQAQHEARHDVLTGLSNRALFGEIVDQQLALCQRNAACLSILYIDLDGFKSINDQYGHAVGDKLLCVVADRIKAGIRDSDLAARLGGDEFAVLLIGATTDSAAAVARKLVDSLSVPYVMEDLTVGISASIGVAGYPDAGSSSKTLFHCADDAMYEAKAMGKCCVVVSKRIDK